MSYMAFSRINPVLLTAVCNYANDYLNNPSVIKNQIIVKHIAELMQKLSSLVKYLGGGSKYELLCEQAEMY